MQVCRMQGSGKLGQMGEIVAVKPGFARNYRLPQKKALRATKENLARFETQRSQLEADNLKHRDEAAQVPKSLDGMTVTLIRQAGESGQPYAPVNSRAVAEPLTAQRVTVPPAQTALAAETKVIGLHKRHVTHPPHV